GDALLLQGLFLLSPGAELGGRLVESKAHRDGNFGRIGKSNGIFALVSLGAHPRNPAAWTLHRLCLQLPAPAGQRAGAVRGASSGCPGGERRGTAGRGGGRRAHGPAQAHREARGLRGAHVAARTTRAWAESNPPSSGRQRAGAIGGGTDASWRCRRIRVITDSWVMTAMRCREPRRHNGQVRISSPKTRPSSLAQGQYGVPVGTSAPSSPCWRGVGMMLPRTWRCGARQPPERTRWTRGRGTRAASFSRSATGESRMPMVPSDHGWVKV